ncbi:MAG TPA: response regulator [Alphaproteobacteria bacterium]|nr:response regulator [Alphaproteobacteria bacterium]
MDDAAHILVADDDVRLRGLLQQFLTRHGFRVTTAADAKEAIARFDSIAFDLLILDVMMPGESGLELTKRLRAASEVPILLLTAMGEPADRIAGLSGGADDYLVKPFEPDELLLRVRNILRRTPPAPAAVGDEVRFGDFRFDLKREELHRGNALIRLTAAETSLLKVLAQHAGEAVKRGDLLRLSRISGGERTVDVQVTRLRRKIEADPKLPRFIQTARGAGYLLRVD